MIEIRDLPHLNALLNTISAVLLWCGYRWIRAGRRAAHRAAMLAAFGSSTLFLASYLTYHAQIGSRPFTGAGWIRPLYFTILLSHTVLAATVVPLVLVTLHRALRGRFEAHRRIARWTFPIWLYVSITGVLVYLLLYRLG
jgi:uncharacterized membrane protein YozB (DUF420 family)